MADIVRLPASVVTSVAMHAAAAGLYLYTAGAAHKQTQHIVTGVDLLIQTRKVLPAPAQASPKAATPPSTWNFLKMALPEAPRMAVPVPVAAKLPELKKLKLADATKLEERRRLEVPKLAGMDLGERKIDMAKIEQRLESRQAAKLAELPRLEEVGQRQARNLPQRLALEEERRQTTLQTIQAAEPAATRRAAQAQAPTLREASPPEASRLSQKIAAFLPAPAAEERARPMAAPMDDFLKKKVEGTAMKKREAAAAPEQKKGVEIEGPLADRKVLHYEVPEFPDWARKQGVIEASVAIRFWVNKEGSVLGDTLRVEHTSGYGRLDRLTMDSLKKLKFLPLMSDERQWGVITFRFIME